MTHFRNVLFIVLLTTGFIPLYAQQRGKASFYSRRATGARTSSGERLHHDSLTCAHRTHPFGTLLKVKNLSNGKEVVVRVTDRGPFGRGRIIDLSWAAAKALGMLSQGVAAVEIVPVRPTTIPFKDDAPTEMPRMEFDLVENDYPDNAFWKKEETEKAAKKDGKTVGKKSEAGKPEQLSRQPSSGKEKEIVNKNNPTSIETTNPKRDSLHKKAITPKRRMAKKHKFSKKRRRK